MLRDAPLGVDWDSVGDNPASQTDNLDALLDVCNVATGLADSACFLPLRATTEMEQVQGPGNRYVSMGNWGTVDVIMKHWPVVAILGGQCALTATFPRQWQPIPQNQFDIPWQMTNLFSGSSVGISGGDGDSLIQIAPGYITGWGGRGGYVIQIAYTNGWPHSGLLPSATLAGNLLANDNQITNISSTAGLQVGASAASPYLPSGTVITEILDANNVILSNEALSTVNAVPIQYGYGVGVTTLNVDDVTGFGGTIPQIYDGSASELVTVTGAAATNPPVILSGGGQTVTAQAGPGTLTLSQPTTFAHTATNPPQALVTTLPDAIRLACYYFAAGEAMTRGATAITAQAMPGSITQVGGAQYSPGSLNAQGEKMLKNFARVV